VQQEDQREQLSMKKPELKTNKSILKQITNNHFKKNHDNAKEL
jgi:hypothetical protein